MIPTTGMASTIVIKTKLSGITSRLRRSKVRRPRHPNARRMNTGCNAAFYPEATDRGKNMGNAAQVSGFDTLPFKGGHSTIAILLYITQA